MITVACVLKSGGVYNPAWVRALRAGVFQYLLAPHRFCVLTDIPADYGPGVRVEPLLHDLPGWWSKMELFRPSLFDGPVVYLDLDTLPVGNLYWMHLLKVDPRDLVMLSDFYKPTHPQSGFMAWTPGDDTASIWRAWSVLGKKGKRGDGEWLAANCPIEIVRIQDLVPDRVVSYKVHATRSIPRRASLVCAHGNPKFNDPKSGWAHQVWRDRT